LGEGATYTEKYKSTMEFLSWPLKPEEFSAATKFVLLTSLILATLIAFILFFAGVANLVAEITGSDLLAPAYIFAPLVILALYGANYFQTYPLGAAKAEQVKALTYVPEVVGYMIMSIKLVPNLEKAVEFSAEHGRGLIAIDLKRLVWDVQLGVYNDLSEGLDSLAYRWGKFSDEFKRSLMMVRASVIENTEAKRYALLDKTMAEILESIKQKMEQYARDLSQPSITLFYIGVLLPLILIIVLPVGSSFSGAALADPMIMFVLYNILLPISVFLYARKLISQRPPTSVVPDIPADFPGLPPKWKIKVSGIPFDLRILIVLILIIGLGGSYIFSTQGIPPKFMVEGEDRARQLIPYDQTAEEVLLADPQKGTATYFDVPDGLYYNQLLNKTGDPNLARIFTEKDAQLYFLSSENDITPYNLIFGLLLTFTILLSSLLYYTTIYRRKIQADIEEMESEFKDSLYVLASRMGENKPIEEAIKHTTEFLPNLKISKKIYAKTLDNISLLGMPLHNAVFDPSFGALKDVPSSVIRGSMKLLIDSVALGVNVAARTLISLSIQLQNSEQVSKTLAILVSDITTMMRTIAIFIAPLVLGITTVLQKVVILTISEIAASDILSNTENIGELTSPLGGSFSSIDVGTIISSDVIGTIATPTEFIFIITLYIIQIVAILVYFTTNIESDNPLLVRLNIAKSLPIAVIIFVFSVLVANIFISGLIG